jgi:DUF4097 and DUF4098 domain-containing protein YvlB
MEHEFSVDGPIQVYVEIGAGLVEVTAEDTGTARVRVDGDVPVHVDLEGDELRVVEPRRTGFGFSHGVQVRLVVPSGSSVVTKTGSADTRVRGPLGWVRLRTGSGNVTLDTVQGETEVRTGSGSVGARELGGSTRVKTGSGSIRIGHLLAEASLKTGSGDIEVERADRPVSLKSGSGNLAVGHAEADVEASAASGNLLLGTVVRGRADLSNASGNIRVRIAPGTPVWSDVSTVTGHVTSELPPVGPPEGDQDYVELHARSVSGNIRLEPVERAPRPHAEA